MAKNLSLSASLATSKADLACYQGEDVVVTVSLSPPADITGWSLACTVRRQYGDAEAVLAKTTGGGITITDAGNGVFQVSIPSGDTTTLERRAYVFDIQRTNTGQRTVLTIGNFTLLPQVSL